VTLTVVAGPGSDVSGVFNYMSPAPQSMDNCMVAFMDGNIMMGAASLTDLAGNFSFIGLPDGTFAYAFTTNKARGGTNILDAINTRQFLGGGYPMDGLQQTAANVNGNPVVDILDAIFIQMSLSGPLPAGWIAPDFVDEGIPVIISGGNVVQDLETLCSGDPNRSYSPIPLGK
ncbi:MAG: hypothetical protein K8S16_00240, partial [Bacteroidales bacterium]|nr:hypothetical protein [Bacteroidales bacterium]